MNQRFPSNPFSSRHVRPGAIPYRFPANDSITSLLDRLQECGWRGAVVGPHGSGKSTLLCSLVPELDRYGWNTRVLTLHNRQRWLPRGWMPIGSRQFLVIDGFEQLNRIGRWWLRILCRARGWGLLVTSHEPVGLPAVHFTRTSPGLLATLARELTCNADRLVTNASLADAFSRSQGNLREAFFELYDHYEKASTTEPQVGTIRRIDTAGSILPVI